ncbi:relaxase/mobilization nuclease domain-containing protein [Streptomyces olivoreticuli]
MIAKISSGKNTAKLIAYLYGPGRANEHTDPHLVASWDGIAPDPGRSEDFNGTKSHLVKALDLRVKQAGDRAPEQYVWHCSIRTAPEDHTLSDDEWADIARRVVNAAGIAPEGDPDGCRWVAVRHADDHIHIAATKVRGDLRTARHWNDYLRADKELAAIERDYGLRQVVRGDRTAAERPTRAEKEKARRTGHRLTARERLRATIRTVASAATTEEEFLAMLSGSGVLVEAQRFPSGDLRGYKAALPDDTNASGEPIWFSGSKLAPDLSLPKIRERLNATSHEPTSQRTDSRKPSPWHRATAAAGRIPGVLDHGDDDAAAQAHIAAFGELMDALPLLAPTNAKAQLQQAALAFERATRSRIRAEHHHARALRSSIKRLLRDPVGRADGTGLAMLLDAAVLVVMAAARWHDIRRHEQQAVAARETLRHLQAAYGQAAQPVLAELTRHTPRAEIVRRYEADVRRALPEHAERILADPAWPALTTTLARAETAGHQPHEVLAEAAAQRELHTAQFPAEVLTWRITNQPGKRTTTATTRRSQTSRGEISAGPLPAHRQPASPDPRGPHR